MLKEYFKFILKVLVIVMTYYILDYLFEKVVMISILVVIAVLFVLYNTVIKNDFEYKLELMCDPNAYLKKVMNKYINRDENFYNTYLAYAYVHQGDYSNAAHALSKVDFESIKDRPDLVVKFYNTSFKLAFNNNDLDKYALLLNEFDENLYSKSSKVDIDIFKAPKYLLEEDYIGAIDLLKVIIPRQHKRNIVLELEYYLAKAYMETEYYEDAKAVLEFVSKRSYNLIYIEKCKELLKELDNSTK